MIVLKFVAILILSLLFTFCSNEYKPNVTNNIFDVSLDTIDSEIWFPDLMAVNTRSIIEIQSTLCLIAPNEQSLIYCIDNKTNKELGYVGIVGEGPQDMQPLPIYAGKSVKGDTIYLYDFNAKKLNAYNLSQAINGNPKLDLIFSKKLPNPLVGKYTSSYMGISRLQNGYYVGLNFLSLGDKFLTLLDDNLNVVKEFGEQPLKGLPPKGSIKNFRSFDGTLCTLGNSVYYAASKFGYLARYDISKEGEIIHKWTQRYADVDYKIENKQNIKFSSNNLNGFSDLTVGKKFIYATYSGIPFSEIFKARSVNAAGAKTLVVYNHDGEALGRFKLKSCSFTIGISENEEYIYVMNIDPEIQLERIKVSDIEKLIKD